LLHEVEKEDAREDQQGLGIDRLAPLVRERAAELRGGVAHRGAETVEELAGECLAVEGAVEDAREVARTVEREDVEAVDRMRRRRVQIDVEAAELAPRREVVKRQALRRAREEDRLGEDVPRMERFEETRCSPVVDVVGDVAVEARHARREGEGIEIDVDSGAAPFGWHDGDGLHWISKLAQEREE
jgi:hypothetical protein